ncbi:hypothetical protein JAAARDRAFT_59743 [Jaapia argillacea MUCL 33604]|uniref:F-box domain-containing protein n=1 Tax=Jaapia argillacea MUCL 33604 TaxID=933084 RepID=A0A067PLK5_9AGAM|nr:hypothetical protein JAAARDRAFT_59743 [Jaapia argillacea MUCL 33604]
MDNQETDPGGMSLANSDRPCPFAEDKAVEYEDSSCKPGVYGGIEAVESTQPGTGPVDLPLEVWLLIFKYATYIPEATNVSPMDPFQRGIVSNGAMSTNTPVLSMRTKCTLVGVCRAWRSLATELLFEFIPIRSHARSVMILSTLKCGVPRKDGVPLAPGMSKYGRWTKHIEISAAARGGKSIRFFENIYQIFQHCPNVRILTMTWASSLPAGLLSAIPQFYSQTLERLYWDGLTLAHLEMPSGRRNQPSVFPPACLALFQSLSTLDVRHLPDWTGIDVKVTLPRIRDLVLSTWPSSLEVASSLTLPGLHRVILHVPEASAASNSAHQLRIGEEELRRFLSIHGPNITHLQYYSTPTYVYDSEAHMTRVASHPLNLATFIRPGICPNLQDLVFESHEHVIDVSSITEPHSSLRRIGIVGLSVNELYPDKPSLVVKHLLSFDPTHFPGLEVVRTVGFLVAAKASEEVKDVFVWWTERFEKKGIDFQDGEGVIWLYTEEEPAPDGKKPTEVGSGLKEQGVGTEPPSCTDTKKAKEIASNETIIVPPKSPPAEILSVQILSSMPTTLMSDASSVY